MRIDVVIPTRDKIHIHPALMRVLKTANWVNNIIVETSKPLSLARVRGARKCKTDIIAMFDDDVEIPSDWYPKLVRHLENGVLAVSSPYIEMNPHLQAYQKVVKWFRSLSRLDTPYICNILVRRGVLTEYTPPPCFSLEDELLYRYVKGKGRWVHSEEVGVKHWYKVKDGTESGYMNRRLSIDPPLRFFRRLMVRFILSIAAVHYSRDPETILVYWRWNFQLLKGYLSGS